MSNLDPDSATLPSLTRERAALFHGRRQEIMALATTLPLLWHGLVGTVSQDADGKRLAELNTADRHFQQIQPRAEAAQRLVVATTYDGPALTSLSTELEKLVPPLTDSLKAMADLDHLAAWLVREVTWAAATLVLALRGWIWLHEHPLDPAASDSDRHELAEELLRQRQHCQESLERLTEAF